MGACLVVVMSVVVCNHCFFFQAEDGIRDLVRSRGLGDVYKRQESDKSGMRAVIELKRGEVPEIVLNNLFKLTPMQELSLIHI